MVSPALRELQYRDSEKDLRSFVRYGWETFEPSTPFVPCWHLDAICDHLMAVSLGHIRRLVINIPPRHGKSLVTSVFWPAWEWIQWPHITSIYTSYNQTFALRDSIKTRDIIGSDWYQNRWWDRFQLTEDQNAKIRFNNDRGGFRLVKSFSSGGTGEGADKVVADDPINLEDSENLNALERVIYVWTTTLRTRLRDLRRGAHVVIMQRCHERDLSGFLLAAQAGYVHLNLPTEYDPRRHCVTVGASVRPVPKDDRTARVGPYGKQRRTLTTGYALREFNDPRSEDGQLLAPERMDAALVDEMKNSPEFGPWRFQAQFNQDPTPRDGAMFPAEHWQYWTRPPVDQRGQVQFDEWLQSWDCAFKDLQDSDYVVGQVWARIGVNFYLIDQDRGRMSFSKTCDAIERLSARWPMAVRKLVEDKANGTAVIDALKKRVPGLVPVEPLGGKIARANAVTPYHEGHNLYLPATPAAGVQCEWPDPNPRARGAWIRHDASWVPAFVSECERFPKAINDDQVDSMTQAINYWIPKIARSFPMAVGAPRSYWQGPR